MKLNVLLAAMLPLTALAAPVEKLAVPRVFSDHAVLQKSARTPVWGWAPAGEEVAVELKGTPASAKATTGAEGNWRVDLDLSAVGEGPFELVITGASGSVTLTDILVGEVWLFSGQSNMRFHLARGTGGEADAAQASDPQLRLLSVGLKISNEPVHDIKQRWTTCDPKTAGEFSAVGYYVGRELRKSVKGPVGLVSICWAGSPIEAWMSPAALAGDPDFLPITEKWAKRVAEYPAKKAEWEANKVELLAKWEADAAAAKAAGQREPVKPGGPNGGPDSLDTPSGLYHGEILAFAPYAMRGVVWYQGEQNSGRGFQYRKLLPALIADWRGLWNQGEFPFIIIGIPNFGKVKPDPGFSMWAELREAQAMADASVPGTELVCTIDLGEDGDVHPKDKRSVGLRAARVIEKQVYQVTTAEVFGPVFREMSVENGAIRVKFNHAEGLKAKDGGPLKEFAISGADRKFAWAEAVIEGDTVLLRSEKVPNPVAARYNWADAPHGNLYNAADLPAAPFRTDDFPAQSRDSK
jgi:sialate O-acetylesterase